MTTINQYPDQRPAADRNPELRAENSMSGVFAVLGVLAVLAVGYFVYQSGAFDNDNNSANVASNSIAGNANDVAPAAGSNPAPASRLEQSTPAMNNDTTDMDRTTAPAQE